MLLAGRVWACAAQAPQDCVQLLSRRDGCCWRCQVVLCALCVRAERERLQQFAADEEEREAEQEEMMDSPAKRQRLQEGAAEDLHTHRWAARSVLRVLTPGAGGICTLAQQGQPVGRVHGCWRRLSALESVAPFCALEDPTVEPSHTLCRGWWRPAECPMRLLLCRVCCCAVCSLQAPAAAAAGA